MAQKSALVIPILERAFLKKTSKEWLGLLQKADIVCEILNHFRDVTKDEQAFANEFIQEYTCHNGETCFMPCPPIRLGSQPFPKAYSTSMAGEDTVQVLHNMGYSIEVIEQLISEGAVQAFRK